MQLLTGYYPREAYARLTPAERMKHHQLKYREDDFRKCVVDVQEDACNRKIAALGSLAHSLEACLDGPRGSEVLVPCSRTDSVEEYLFGKITSTYMTYLNLIQDR